MGLFHAVNTPRSIAYDSVCDRNRSRLVDILHTHTHTHAHTRTHFQLNSMSSQRRFPE